MPTEIHNQHSIIYTPMFQFCYYFTVRKERKWNTPTCQFLTVCKNCGETQELFTHNHKSGECFAAFTEILVINFPMADYIFLTLPSPPLSIHATVEVHWSNIKFGSMMQVQNGTHTHTPSPLHCNHFIIFLVILSCSPSFLFCELFFSVIWSAVFTHHIKCINNIFIYLCIA